MTSVPVIFFYLNDNDRQKQQKGGTACSHSSAQSL